MTRFASILALGFALASSACVVVQSPPPAAASPAAPAAPAKAKKAAATQTAEGRPPALQPGANLTIWIWHEGDVWHLSTTTAGNQHRFTGTVTGNASKVVGFTPTATEAEDQIKILAGRITFDLTTAGQEDGFFFGLQKDGCVDFDLSIDGAPAPPDRIFVGATQYHPKRGAFTACY